MDALTKRVVAAVEGVCVDPNLDRRGTYAHGQRVIAERVLTAVGDVLTDAAIEELKGGQ